MRGINRAVALLLALIWLGAGLVGLYYGIADGRWWLLVWGILATAWSTLWLRVFVRSRLLTWRELAVPWRVR